jgi:hypothetical protein
MVIAVCIITLRFPGSQSLKEKRSVIKPLLTRLRQRFNVSVAEIAGQDKWQLGTVAVACVSGNRENAHRLLQQALVFIERNGEIEVIDVSFEML